MFCQCVFKFFDTKTLELKIHGPDFGLESFLTDKFQLHTKNNRTNINLFKDAIHDHVQGRGIEIIEGTYRGNKKNGVVFDEDAIFHLETGFKAK